MLESHQEFALSNVTRSKIPKLNSVRFHSMQIYLSAISFLLASNHSHEWILKLTFLISTFKIQIREIFERSCLSVCQYKMKHVRILYLISLRILKRYFESIYTPFPVRIISNNSNLIDFDVKVSRYRNITIHWQILSDVSMRIHDVCVIQSELQSDYCETALQLRLRAYLEKNDSLLNWILFCTPRDNDNYAAFTSLFFEFLSFFHRDSWKKLYHLSIVRSIVYVIRWNHPNASLNTRLYICANHNEINFF